MKFHKQYYLVLGTLLVGCIGLVYLNAGAVLNLWHQWTTRPLVWSYSGEFHEQIKNADRIVVRDGGYGCCYPADEQKVFLEVTDPAQIQLVYTNVQFRTPVEGNLMPCPCCGDVGVDWYQGNKRIALTAFLGGGSIRWRGFRAGGNYPGGGIPGQAPLTPESTKWFREWLINHGLEREELYP